MKRCGNKEQLLLWRSDDYEFSEERYNIVSLNKILRYIIHENKSPIGVHHMKKEIRICGLLNNRLFLLMLSFLDTAWCFYFYFF